MYKIIKSILVAAICCWATTACDEFEYIHTTQIRNFEINPSPVGTVIGINRTDTIYDQAPETLFRWKKTMAEDGTAIFYNIIFVGENGTFDSPSYSIVTNTLGTADSIKITNETMNIIAERCGIAPGKKGRVRWSVRAGNGANSQLASNESSFEVERPTGYADYPTALFILGDAAGNGNDLSKGLRAVCTQKGTFDIFVELGKGSLYFADKIVASPRFFYIKDGVIADGKEGVSPNTTDVRKVYRMGLTFYKNTVNITEIEEVDWVVCNNPSGASPSIVNEHKMKYTSNVCWEIANVEAKFSTGASFAGSTAYKFKVSGKNTKDGTPVISYFGSLSAPSAWTATNAVNWYYLGEGKDFLNAPPSSRFRLSTAVGGENLKVGFTLQPGITYSHSMAINYR